MLHPPGPRPPHAPLTSNAPLTVAFHPFIDRAVGRSGIERKRCRRGPPSS
jgi:hypothetical protein